MENIIENNRLIAEFMGIEVLSLNEYKAYLIEQVRSGVRFAKEAILDTDLEYHPDWNRLMEVVEKIESLDFVLNIRQGHVSVLNNSGKSPFYNGGDIVEVTKITAVYNTCVEFIKWYNLNK